MLMNASGCNLITVKGWDFKVLFLLCALNWLVLLWCSAFGCWCEQRCFKVLLNGFVLVIILSSLLEIFYWVPVQLFLAVWRLAIYLSVGTGAVKGGTDSSLGSSPLGQDFVPSASHWCGGERQLLLFLSLPWGYIPVNRTLFAWNLNSHCMCVSHLCDALTLIHPQ